MDAFDEMLRRRAQEEITPLPEGYSQRLHETCSALQATAPKQHTHRHWLIQAAAIFVCLLIAIPNCSESAARAMHRVPILGAVVDVVTFRQYEYEDDFSNANVSVPQIVDGGTAGEQVNESVQRDTDRLIAEFEADAAEMEGGHQGLDVRYTVVTDTDDWFTLRVDVVQIMASGAESKYYYHINKLTDQVVTLSDLFPANSDYVSVLSEEVLRQMEEQMAADENMAYFPESFQGIDPEQNFYWNENHELVLVFDEYTIAAGVMGCPEFVIPGDIYNALTQKQ